MIALYNCLKLILSTNHLSGKFESENPVVSPLLPLFVVPKYSVNPMQGDNPLNVIQLVRLSIELLCLRTLTSRSKHFSVTPKKCLSPTCTTTAKTTTLKTTTTTTTTTTTSITTTTALSSNNNGRKKRGNLHL